MALKAEEKLKLDRIQAAMLPLVGQPAFTDFMAVIRDLKDEAVGNSVAFETVASERHCLVSKGEVLTYLNILGVYESQLEQLAQHNEQAQE